MKLNKTDLLILTALTQAYGPQTVSELYRALPANLFANKRALSSRLCEMRGRNLLTSKTLDSGINEWLATDSALLMLPAVTADSSAATEIPVSEPTQPDSPEPAVSEPMVDTDKTDATDPIAADFAAAMDAAEVVDATVPPYDDSDSIHETIATVMGGFNALGTPICADLDEVDATPEVSDDLIEEANSLRLRRPLPREHEALFVLSVLIDTLGRNQPAMAYELTRIAAYIEGEVA